MDKQITGHVMRRLLKTHFVSKADMARQLGIQPRTIQRAFEHLDGAKAGTIVLDKAICYCAIHHISLDSILDSFESDANREGNPMYDDKETQAYQRLLLKQPANLTPDGVAMYESMLRFLRMASAHVCPGCKTWCNPWSGERFAEDMSCFIGHMAREIRYDLSDVNSGGDPVK